MLGFTTLGRLTGTLALVSALCGMAGTAAAETPLTLVVPYGAGGTTDNFARMLAQGMSSELGRPVIVENKPGANGIIGATYVSRANPDGNTVLLGGTGPISLNVMLRPKLPYSLESFESVAMLFEGMLTITVPTKLGVNSIPELVAYGKKSSTGLRIGTLGPGSVTDLYNLVLAKALDVEVMSIPYKNNPSALIDLMGGLGDVTTATPIAVIEHQKAGDLKILALTTEKRDPAFPDIPSVTELGFPQLKATYWTALHAPKGTPPAVIEKLSAAAVKTVQSDSFRALLANNGQMEKAGGPAALDAQLKQDAEHWGAVIRENNIVLE
ncbi:tripartite tricarboxylate transporter substrate binding protein [Verticiella alkaliphila]|uniref:tripartite tricarboxylate transporter substrate binding protein n=1 Tax=Verticiella alkaliphila TaxID=2779529 RepID=UPI00209A7F7F|nr:tripartite tricarboxylate transporter substrate binding protein [Verticiella sp. GG226]